MFALSSGTSGESGDYSATPLTGVGSAQVGLSAGSVDASYPIEMPPAPAGPVPTVDFTYSSASVDGMATDHNTQASEVGIGWNQDVGSIEREYKTCAVGLPDRCWAGENYRITLNGKTSRLIPAPGTGNQEWRLVDDPDWRVTKTWVLSNKWLDETSPSLGAAMFTVVTPDGTKYRFGGNQDVETGAFQNSLWPLKVWNPNPGDPCYAEAVSFCSQAWKWALDRVEDTSGNVISYYYSTTTNYYKALMGLGGPWQNYPYVQSGRVDRIYYSNTTSATSPLEESGPRQWVQFWYANRCTTVACGFGDYPDTPWDLWCPIQGTTCDDTSPSFWSALRLDAVTTFADERINPGDTPLWRLARKYVLSQSYPDPGDTVPPSGVPSVKKLQLDAITRYGDQDHPLPEPTRYGYVFKPNRVNYGSGIGVSPMLTARLSQVTSELGGRKVFWYGQPQPCPTNTVFDFTNFDKDCFPGFYAPPGATAGWIPFQKWIVVQTTDIDLAGGQPQQDTIFQYDNGPGWRYAQSPVLPEVNQVSGSEPSENWNDYRGHRNVRVVDNGTAHFTEYRFYTGMDGDRANASGTAFKSVTFTNLDGAPQQDWYPLGGQEASNQRVENAAIDVVWQRHTSNYFFTRTVGPDGWGSPYVGLQAHWVAPSEIIDFSNGSNGGKTSKSTYAYDVNHLGPAVYETHNGDIGISTDNRHIDREIASNPFSAVHGLPAREYVRTGLAQGGGTQVARTDYQYDGENVGGMGLTGRLTHVTKFADASLSATTETQYDVRGRPTKTIDPRGNDATYGYFLNGGKRQLHTTNELGHVTKIRTERQFGANTWIQNPNAGITSLSYDEYGRRTGVQYPGDTGDTTTYSYVPWTSGTPAPPAVETQQKFTGGTRTTRAYIDGRGRPLQTATVSPTGTAGAASRTSTSYDPVGRVLQQSNPYQTTGTGGAYTSYKAPTWTGSGAVPSYHEYTYDFANREITDSLKSPTATLWTNGTGRDGWTTKFFPPTGAETDQEVDGFGNLKTVTEWHNPSNYITNYTYDAADRMTSIVDAAGNPTLNVWDQLGRKTSMSDPDAGGWSYQYDLAGNLTQQTDARNKTVVSTYDGLNRPVTKRQDSSTGALIAQYTYDSTPYLGLPASSTSYDNGNAYTTSVTQYDARSRPTERQWTIPTAATGVSGTYKMRYTYGADDQPVSVQYPGGSTGTLGETVTTSYNATGQPNALAGTNTYVNASAYDATGQLTSQTLGTSTIARSLTYDAATQRLATLKAGSGGSSTNQQNLTYAYNSVSDVTSITDINDASQRQCFKYDDRNRLTLAFTGDNACTSYDNARGTDEYDQAFAYNAIGNLTSAAGRTYTYGDAAHKHAPTQVGSDSFTYDANGSQTGRVVGGSGAILGYDYLNRLNVVGSTVTSSYVYDADGNRLTRKDGTTVTLYLEGGNYQRTSVNGAAATVTTQYQLGAQRAAVRKGSNLYYELADQLGSNSTSYKSDGTSTTRQRYYPFGALRPGPANNLPVDETYIGKTRDAVTGLTQMGARYYDATLGRFISTDPLARPGNPQSLNPYTYGLNNPLNISDPSGLLPGGLDSLDNAVCMYYPGNPGCRGGIPPRPAPSPREVEHAASVRPAIGRALGRCAAGTYAACGAAALLYNGGSARAAKRFERHLCQRDLSLCDVGSATADDVTTWLVAGAIGGLAVAPFAAAIIGGTETAILGAEGAGIGAVEQQEISQQLTAATQVNPWAGMTVSRVTQAEEIMYRVWGGGAGRESGWLSQVEPTSASAARAGLALPPQNLAEFVSRVVVPAGTRVQVGTAGAAFDQPGGWPQVQVLARIPSENFSKGVSLAP
jgi:RHS repeat-associated protein